MCQTCKKLGHTCTMCQAEQAREGRPAHKGTIRTKAEREA